MSTFFHCWPEPLEYLDGLSRNRSFVSQSQIGITKWVEVSYVVIITTLQIMFVSSVVVIERLLWPPQLGSLAMFLRSLQSVCHRL